MIPHKNYRTAVRVCGNCYYAIQRRTSEPEVNSIQSVQVSMNDTATQTDVTDSVDPDVVKTYATLIQSFEHEQSCYDTLLNHNSSIASEQKTLLQQLIARLQSAQHSLTTVKQQLQSREEHIYSLQNHLIAREHEYIQQRASWQQLSGQYEQDIQSLQQQLTAQHNGTTHEQRNGVDHSAAPYRTYNNNLSHYYADDIPADEAQFIEIDEDALSSYEQHDTAQQQQQSPYTSAGQQLPPSYQYNTQPPGTAHTTQAAAAHDLRDNNNAYTSYYDIMT